MIAPQSPCYKCKDRKEGCHNAEICEAWGKYEAKVAEAKRKRYAEYYSVFHADSFRVEGNRKGKRRKRQKGSK